MYLNGEQETFFWGEKVVTEDLTQRNWGRNFIFAAHCNEGVGFAVKHHLSQALKNTFEKNKN